MKNKHSYYREFGWGAIEGLALGVVIGICTGGIGFLAMPIFGFLRGLDKVNKMHNINKSLPMSLGGERDDQLRWNLVKGTFSGAAYGASAGLVLAGFTFGLSIAIGALAGAVYGIFEAYAQESINKKAMAKKSNEPFLAGQGGLVGLLGGAALGLGLLLAPFTGGLSLIPSLVIVAGGALAGAGFGAGMSTWISNQFGKTQHAKSTSAATTVGMSGGAVAGAIIGALFSPFTLGLSIPLCALIGAFVGGSGFGLVERFTGFFEKVYNLGRIFFCYPESEFSEGSWTPSPPLGADNSNHTLGTDSNHTSIMEENEKKQEERRNNPLSTNSKLVNVGGSASHHGGGSEETPAGNQAAHSETPVESNVLNPIKLNF